MAQTIDEIDVEEDVKFDYNNLNGYNPLGQNVEDKEYTRANIRVSGDIPIISEPQFAPPSIAELDLTEGEDEESEDPVFGKQDTNDLPPKEKQQAAEQLVELVLQGYAALHTFGHRFAIISESNLLEKQAKGDIDLRMHIPISETESIGVADFVESYNKEVTETLTLDEDFKESVRPVMERIAAKKGYGLSDEQFLLVMFGKDIIQKAAGVISLKNQLNKTLKIVHEQYQQANAAQFFQAEVVRDSESNEQANMKPEKPE